MARRKRVISLTDFHSVVLSEGEIAVGAYARAQRRKRIMLGLAGLALIGGAVWLHFALQPGDTPRADWPQMLVRCVVPSCGYEGVVRLAPERARFPLKCPKCGQRSLQKVWECRDCGERFLRRAELETPDGILHCPKCGGVNVGTAEGPADRRVAGGADEVRGGGESGR